jgi:hypothetical protein
MFPLPANDIGLVVRSHFSSDEAWQELRLILESPGEDGFGVSVTLIDDQRFRGISVGDAIGLLPLAYRHPILVLVDAMTLTAPGFPLQVISLREPSGHCIRVVATELQTIEVNLSLANMDFDEFAAAADGDGVFRGHRRT